MLGRAGVGGLAGVGGAARVGRQSLWEKSRWGPGPALRLGVTSLCLCSLHCKVGFLMAPPSEGCCTGCCALMEVFKIAPGRWERARGPGQGSQPQVWLELDAQRGGEASLGGRWCLFPECWGGK